MTLDACSASSYDDHVAVLRWPEQRAEADRLRILERPRLLLVEPGAEAPLTVGYLEDWIRLPADYDDVRARVHSLARRAVAHPTRPGLDECGELSFRDKRVFLSPTDERIARVLVESFDRGVPESQILETVWNGRGSATALRVHISRLRKRIAPLGLGITAIRGFGYRLHGPNPANRQDPNR